MYYGIFGCAGGVLRWLTLHGDVEGAPWLLVMKFLLSFWTEPKTVATYVPTADLHRSLRRKLPSSTINSQVRV